MILETGTFLYHFTICLHGRERSYGAIWGISMHFRPLFPFQLGGNSAPEMIGAWPKETGNLIDLSYGVGGPESGPLSLRPHVLMATIEGWKR
jgi:hypothetical protein